MSNSWLASCLPSGLRAWCRPFGCWWSRRELSRYVVSRLNMRAWEQAKMYVNSSEHTKDERNRRPTVCSTDDCGGIPTLEREIQTIKRSRHRGGVHSDKTRNRGYRRRWGTGSYSVLRKRRATTKIMFLVWREKYDKGDGDKDERVGTVHRTPTTGSSPSTQK